MNMLARSNSAFGPEGNIYITDGYVNSRVAQKVAEF